MTPAEGLAGSPRGIDDVPRGLGERLSDVSPASAPPGIDTQSGGGIRVPYEGQSSP